MDTPTSAPGQAWRDRAACVGHDTERFYPAGTTGAALDQAEQAKAVCAVCDVRPQCLDYALGTNQDAGVWGGMTEDERRTYRRSRQWHRSG
ncbi:MAG: WhiB family transcriptional regulator [Egibacteraceae bacterium]